MRLLIFIVATFIAETVSHPYHLRSHSSFSRNFDKSRSLNSPDPAILEGLFQVPPDLNPNTSDTISAGGSNGDNRSSSFESSSEYSLEAESQVGDGDLGESAASPISNANLWMYLVSGSVLIGLVGVACKKTYEKEEASEAKLNLVEESETEVHSTVTRRKGWRNKFRFGRNRARTNENSQTVSV